MKLTRHNRKVPRIFRSDGVLMTTSLALAEQFELPHEHILEAIELTKRHLDDEDYSNQQFIPWTHIDDHGVRLPIYRLLKTGFFLIASELIIGPARDLLAMDYIAAFEELQTSQQPDPNVDKEEIDRSVKKKLAFEARSLRFLTLYGELGEPVTRH